MDLFNDLPLPKNENNSSKLENNDDDLKNENVKKRANDDDDNGENENDQIDCSKTKKQCTELLKLKGYIAERKGERDEMQDRHVIIENYLEKHLKDASSDIRRVSYYAIFDGHSGVRASEHCANRLHLILAEKFPKGNLEQIEKDIKRCFIDSFKQLDDEFLKIASKNKPAWKDGSTVTVILVINDILYAANIGDSKAIICRKNEQDQCFAILLTKDHNPTLYDERQRIQKCGGQVKEGRILGVLEVSRSIGDGQYKTYGVTSLPDIRKCQLNSSFPFVILACDGLWKSFKNEEAIEFINSTYKQTLATVKDDDIAENKSKDDYIYEICCNKLANEAVKKLTADNVTVLLLIIRSAATIDNHKNDEHNNTN